jgi:hypothetical protein
MTVQKEYNNSMYKIQLKFISNKNFIRKIIKSEMTVKIVISRNKYYDIVKNLLCDYKILEDEDISTIIFFYKNFLNNDKMNITLQFSTKEENLIDYIHLKQTYWVRFVIYI